jgi:hypothetical protein
MGAGKSITACVLANMYHDIDKLKIITNMTLYGLTNYEQKKFSQIKEESANLFNCVIIVDEGQKGSDAYNFFRKDVKEFTAWVVELRKRKITFIMITQVFTQIAKRFRDNTDYLVLPKKVAPDVYQVNIFDLSKVSGEDLIKSFFFDAKLYYDKFETNELLE